MKGTPNTIDDNLKAAGYKFLGWENNWKMKPLKTVEETKRGESRFNGYEDQPEHSNCKEQKHPTDSLSHNNRGSEHTVSCDECKIYWKYDSSD